MREGKFDEADALLKPLFERKRFHVRELSEFCRAEIELELARNHVAAARSWFDLWSNADPEHPQLEATRLRMDAPGWARKLLRR